MIPRERVEAVITRLRPIIQADGGDIELVEVIDNKARIRMSRNCIGCPSAQMTLYMGIETALKEEIPEFEELLVG
jgi:Fe-S cluster biogenesis protein NfuA